MALQGHPSFCLDVDEKLLGDYTRHNNLGLIYKILKDRPPIATARSKNGNFRWHYNHLMPPIQRTPPARNGSRDIVDHVINRFAIGLYAISDWWTIGTEPVSPTVFEIFGRRTREHTHQHRPIHKIYIHDESQYTSAKVIICLYSIAESKP